VGRIAAEQREEDPPRGPERPIRRQDRAPIAAGNRAPSRGRSLNQQA